MTAHEPDDRRAPTDVWPPARDAAKARSTLLGCLGLCCVLLLPALLFLPTDASGLPRWLASLVPLCAVFIAAVGVWLVARVPASAPRHSNDPLSPLTGAGRRPVREVPARRANRLAFACCVALTALVGLGYLLASAADRSGGVLPGTLLAALAGSVLVAYALLATRRRAPMPALRWVIAPVGGGMSPQPIPFVLIGSVAFVWALIVAFEAGYAWAALGAGATILVVALLGPVGQRLPREPGYQQWLREDSET